MEWSEKTNGWKRDEERRDGMKKGEKGMKK